MYLPQALTLDSPALESRQLGGGNYRYTTRRRTKWSSWGRWLVAGILIFGALVLVFIFLCITRRRQRKRQLAAGSQAPMTNLNPGYTNSQAQGGPPLYDQNQNQNQGGYGYGADPGYKGYNQNGAAADYYGQNQQQPQQGGVTQPHGAYIK